MGLQKTGLEKGLEKQEKRDFIYVVATRHKQQLRNKPHKNTQMTWEKQQDSHQAATNALVCKQVWMQLTIQVQQQNMLRPAFR